MLLFIANKTSPDISYAVSVVDRFVNHPKKAMPPLKTILHYLQRTQDQGIIVKPDGTFNLTLWVDAEFAGMYGREPSDSAHSAGSRLAYLITLGGLLLTWRPSLISEICLHPGS